jgi:hypothetical protein
MLCSAIPLMIFPILHSKLPLNAAHFIGLASIKLLLQQRYK